MTTLTEQWKKGELPLEYYYVVCSKNDTIEILQNRVQIVSCSKVGITYDFPDYWEVKQVLAKVPSYEEWRQLKEVVEMIKQGLKETIESYRMTPISRAELLLKEIDQVLQEKE